MVSRPGRDAGVGQAALGGDRGDDRLRAVAAGHRQRVGAGGDGVADQRLEVGARGQLDRLDRARARLVGELESLRLAAAGLRVVEEHRALGVGRGRERDVDGEGLPGGGEGRGGEARDHELPREPPVGDHDHQRGDQRERGAGEAGEPGGAAADHPVPGQGQRGENERRDDEAPREGRDRHHRGRDQGQRSECERGGRREAGAGHRIGPA